MMMNIIRALGKSTSRVENLSTNVASVGHLRSTELVGT
jgi:hypothetical protein